MSILVWAVTEIDRLRSWRTTTDRLPGRTAHHTVAAGQATVITCADDCAQPCILEG
jgi:hypothetical protein